MNRELLSFTRKMSALSDVGLPILRALRAIEKDTQEGEWKNAVVGIIDDIESGGILSEGLAKYPKLFDMVYNAMVQAGEKGGYVEIIFQRLLNLLEEPYKDELARSLRLLGVLVNSGVPILECLSLVSKTCNEKFRQLYEKVNLSIREGESLAVPMQNSGLLPTTIVYLIDCGEESGTLPEALAIAAKLCEDEAESKRWTWRRLFALLW